MWPKTTLFFHTKNEFPVLQFRIRDKSPTYSASQHVCWKTNCAVHKTSWSSISSENTFLRESTVIRQSSKPYILQNSTAIDNYLSARNRVETEWYSGLKGKFLVIKGPDSLALNICIKKALVLCRSLIRHMYHQSCFSIFWWEGKRWQQGSFDGKNIWDDTLPLSPLSLYHSNFYDYLKT